MKSYVQVRVKRVAPEPQQHMVTWMESDPRVKVGSIVTLEHTEGLWSVLEIFKTRLPAPPRAAWRVGGLT